MWQVTHVYPHPRLERRALEHARLHVEYRFANLAGTRNASPQLTHSLITMVKF